MAVGEYLPSPPFPFILTWVWISERRYQHAAEQILRRQPVQIVVSHYHSWHGILAPATHLKCSNRLLRVDPTWGFFYGQRTGWPILKSRYFHCKTCFWHWKNTLFFTLYLWSPIKWKACKKSLKRAATILRLGLHTLPILRPGLPQDVPIAPPMKCQLFGKSGWLSGSHLGLTFPFHSAYQVVRITVLHYSQSASCDNALKGRSYHLSMK